MVILKIFRVVIWTMIGFFVGQTLADSYKDTLKATGGMIMANELLGIKFIPFGVAALVCIVAIKFIFDEE